MGNLRKIKRSMTPKWLKRKTIGWRHVKLHTTKEGTKKVQ